MLVFKENQINPGGLQDQGPAIEGRIFNGVDIEALRFTHNLSPLHEKTGCIASPARPRAKS
jgi:hypothetical protein